MTSTVQTEEVVYRIGLQDAHAQMVSIHIDFPAAGIERLEVLLPAWRPGRYEILDMVGGVRDVRASDPHGESLSIKKTAKATWVIAPNGADVVHLGYRIYANSIGDRTRHADSTHAFLSGCSVFMYSPSMRNAPVRVHIDHAPEGWEVATGLRTLGNGDLFAANYDVLVDSPLEIGLHDRYEFRVADTDYEIVIWPPGIELDSGRLERDFTKIIEAQAAVFGEVPCSRYVFLTHVGVGGGGTEHLNSTIMQTSASALEASFSNDDPYKGFLGLVAHEFFHTWNVKQLRPAGLHPYDYERENYTDLLWVAEGGTSYYGRLSLVRAGLMKEKSYIDSIGRAVNSERTLPGARVQSLAASSFDAWTKFNKRSADDVNSEVSFYSKGALACLLLDLEVRRRTENRASLDTVMRDMYERFPLGGPGYTTDDLVATLDRHSSSSFRRFFDDCIEGTQALDLEAALMTAGLELWFKPGEKPGEKPDEEPEAEAGGEAESVSEEDTKSPSSSQKVTLKASLGLRLRSAGGGAIVQSVFSDGPAYKAGILAGDEILTLNRRRLRSGRLDKRLERMQPGDLVTLHLLRRDELLEIEVFLAGKPDGSWSVKRVDEPTDSQKAVYADWLGHPWPAPKEKTESIKDPR